MKEQDVFYVGIKDPVSVRRDILESSKDIIKNMQSFEKFKDAREERVKLIMHLKHMMDDLQKLNARLKAELPKVELRASEVQQSKGKTTVKKTKTVKTKTVSEAARLEKELDEIESRIKGLS